MLSGRSVGVTSAAGESVFDISAFYLNPAALLKPDQVKRQKGLPVLVRCAHHFTNFFVPNRNDFLALQKITQPVRLKILVFKDAPEAA